MLTLEQLKKMEPNTIFARGTTYLGFSYVRWVAVRGGIEDWAIYEGPVEWHKDYIACQGHKVFGEENIKRLVPCDEEAFQRYRY